MSGCCQLASTPFEIIDHTADLSLVAYGSSLSNLFENAAVGMFSLLGDAPFLKDKTIVQVAVEAEAVEVLLVRWLRELLYHHQRDGLLLRNFSIDRFDGLDLAGEAEGWSPPEDFNPLHDIKAVTYHDIKIEECENGWCTSLIFDV